MRRRLFLMWLLWSSQALAIEVAARVDGAAAFPVGSPQSEVFGPGPELLATFELGLHRYFDVEAQAGWVLLTPRAGGAAGTSLLFGLGARGKAPFSPAIHGWLEGVAHFNRSGEANVPSFSAAVGLSFRPHRALGVGPFVRLTHVLAPASAPEGLSAWSATLVSAGISVELGNTAPEPERVVIGTPPPLPPPLPPRVETDEDGDGVADDSDDCPEKQGPPSNGGCPRYRQVRVTETRLEITQKIFFAYGKTAVMPRSFELLDEVTQALRDRPRLCVRVEGHTDAAGNAESNRVLSEGRARAVRDYLEGHGVTGSRLSSKGYGPSLPMESNATPEGREKNRRVEFVITKCEGATP